jgi:hypothetical protein
MTISRILFVPAMLISAAIGSSATVVVNGLADVAGTSYANLSGAVAYVQSTGSGPHAINITTNTTPNADGQILINTPMTIEGDADNDGNKCDILVDLAGIAAASNVGQAERCYIEVQTSGSVTIRNLKIHPNTDATQTGAGAVNGIGLYKPALVGETALYTLEKVWVSGSDSSNVYIPLDTGTDIYANAGVKRWSRDVSGSTNTSLSDSWASIVLATGTGVGDYSANIINCHAGMSRSTALSVNNPTTSVTITGGLFGHSFRDALHVTSATLTLTGTARNRVRVLRTPHVTGRDAHGVECDGTTVTKMEYVDVECMSSGNGFKFTGQGIATLVQYCRALGKFDAGANSTVFVIGGFQLPDVRKCTFVGSGNDYRPIQVDANTAGNINFTDTIFTSENLAAIAAGNADTLGGIQTLTNCATPTDGTAAESLTVATPITNTSGAFLPTTLNSVTASPQYMLTRTAYDWSEGAVSIDGSSISAGNPNVLRPGNAVYATAATGGASLVGGAGPLPSGVGDWSTY